ncbi:MAG: SRPBCC family protein [Deltaproteobacteria bacterium]|nr:SRPBCC family protein [Deltaproteobacteria bacterium]
MSKATRSIQVGVPPERFFEVLTDFDSYPAFLAGLGMTGVWIRERGDRIRVVEHAVKKMGTTVKYTLRYELSPPERLTWILVKGQMMSKNEGSWRLEPAGESGTRATYSAEIRFGLLVPKSLIKIMLERELDELMQAFKQRAESR